MLKYLLALLLIVTPAAAQTPLTKTQASAQVNATFTDPLNGQITPAGVRSFFINSIIPSYQQAPAVNPQTGTTYTIQPSDYGQIVTFNNSSPVAVTLPQAIGSFAVFNFTPVNLGTGTVTITPTTSTINGASTLALGQTQSVWVSADPAGNYQIAKGFGSGTVSSVALTVPSIFTVAGSPVTTTGTLAVSLATQANNVVFAGPNGGGPLAPTFRALVNADLPTVGISNGGTGQTTAAAARQSSGLDVWGDQGTGHGDAPATIGNTERLAYTNAAFTAARTWTLPAANVTGQPYSVMVADMAGGVTASNTLTIARAGADTINGGTGVTIAAANGAYICYSDGTSKWTCQSTGPASAGGVSSITCNGGLTGGTITTSGTCAVDIATNNNIWGATANKPVDAAGLNNAENPVTLTDAATIALDMSTFINGVVTLTGTPHVMGNPTNTQTGRCGFIIIIQPAAAGPDLVTYASNWKFSNGNAPTLSTANNAVDFLHYCVRSATFIEGNLLTNVK